MKNFWLERKASNAPSNVIVFKRKYRWDFSTKEEKAEKERIKEWSKQEEGQ